jgi:hypothetical protein
MRLVQFNELSGSDKVTNVMFRKLTAAGRELFYHHGYSNRDCCVVLQYSGYKQVDNKTFSCRMLPHEFAHHYQLVDEGFPCILPRNTPHEYFPSFANTFEIGPQKGNIFVDNLLLVEGLSSFFKDFAERAADTVCEGILIKNGYTEFLSNEYLSLASVDPAKNYPQSIPDFNAIAKYTRRLSLRDEAEWHALLNSVYGSAAPLNQMQQKKRQVLNINRDLIGRKHIFNQINEISMRINYIDFKNPHKVIEYVKQISELLNLRVKTEENW